MVLLDVLCNLIHKSAVEMNDASTFDTFQMKMLIAVLSQFHVLIHCLSSRLRHIFHDGAICGKLIQITLNRRDIDGIAVSLQILIDIRRRHGPVTVAF